MKKKKASAARDLNAYDEARRDFGYLEGKQVNSPLDDIALRMIVSNIPKHRVTREETREENTDPKANGRKPKLAA